MSFCEWPEFFTDKYPKGRKDHTCCECGAIIPKGERHGYFAGKWDGDFSDFRQHLDCEQACRIIRDFLQKGECIPFGALFEEFDSNYGSRKDPVDSKFRSIMAKVIWRKEKGRPLTWLKTKKIEHPTLDRDRGFIA